MVSATISAVGKPYVPSVYRLGTMTLLFNAAYEMGLRPAWIVPDSLFLIFVNGREEYVHFGRSPSNSDVGVSLAKNKYLTRMILKRNGERNIPFAHPMFLDDALAFLVAHRKIVAKPLRGSGAHDIHIITTTAQLRRLPVREYILEKYIAGREMRYLVLNGAVIAVHESEYGGSVAEDRPLRRISYPRGSWDHRLISDSLRIANMFGLRFTAIDYLTDIAGHSYVLEVNTMPGLKWFHAPTLGPVVDVAYLFLKAFYLEGSKAKSYH